MRAEDELKQSTSNPSDTASPSSQCSELAALDLTRSLSASSSQYRSRSAPLPGECKRGSGNSRPRTRTMPTLIRSQTQYHDPDEFEINGVTHSRKAIESAVLRDGLRDGLLVGSIGQLDRVVSAEVLKLYMSSPAAETKTSSTDVSSNSTMHHNSSGALQSADGDFDHQDDASDHSTGAYDADFTDDDIFWALPQQGQGTPAGNNSPRRQVGFFISHSNHDSTPPKIGKNDQLNIDLPEKLEQKNKCNGDTDLGRNPRAPADATITPKVPDACDVGVCRSTADNIASFFANSVRLSSSTISAKQGGSSELSDRLAPTLAK